MKKTSNSIILRDLILGLKESPKSIVELSEEKNLDRVTVSRYLKILKEAGVLGEKEEGRKKVFYLKNDYSEKTFFGLPLDEKTENIIDSLYYLIKKEWEKENDSVLLKTTAQKIIFEVVSKLDLKIPKGWYIYGGIVIAPYDKQKNYELKEPSLLENAKNIISETVKKYSYKFAYEAKNEQYSHLEDLGLSKERKKIYILKEDILKILHSKNFSAESLYDLQKKLNEFISISKEYCVSECYTFQNLIIDSHRLYEFLNEEERTFLKQTILSIFETLWNLIALKGFKEDLKEYYDELILEEKTKPDFLRLKEELEEKMSELEEFLSIRFKKLEMLEKAISKMKLRSEEEMKIAEKELETMDSETLRKKFGF